MRVSARNGLLGAWLIALVAGCTPGGSQDAYVNTLHPGYGTTQHEADLAQCRQANSKTVTIPGYEDRQVTQVNAAGTRDCMAVLGWREGV
jgi:hypothetical protein